MEDKYKATNIKNSISISLVKINHLKSPKMKKNVNSFLFYCFTCMFIFTGLSVRAQFSGGIRAGANLVTEPTDNLYHDFLALPYGGVFGTYHVSDPFALELALNYSGEGSNFTDLSTNTKIQVRQSYLAVPLFLQYKFQFGGYIEAGPQLGFLLSANSSINGAASVDNKSSYNSTEFSGGGGLGYNFNHKMASGLGISLRYLRDFSSIVKSSASSTDVKNRVLSIGLTYRFGTMSKK